MVDGNAEHGQIVMPRQKERDYVQNMLAGCLKHGLSALCKEKPEEPIKWLAHWLLDNNPNQPRVAVPGTAAPETSPATSKPEKRTGSVLSAGCVLVPDEVTRSENEHVAYPMPGAPGFVHSTADRTSLVAQCSQEGVGHVLEAMQHGSAGPPSSVVWISTRNEVVTYIAGKPHALRDAAAPLQPKAPATRDGETLKLTEHELKANVEAEVARECGRLALQGAGGLKMSWASVALGSVQTPAEIVEEAGRIAAGVSGTVQTRFECCPLASDRALARQDMTSLLQLLKALTPSDAVVVSSHKAAPVATMVALGASMAHRVRASGGKRPQALTMREPLPLARKYNAPRGLLEEWEPVGAFVASLDDIYLEGSPPSVQTAGCERLGELAKLFCDDTIDSWPAPVHLRRQVAAAGAEVRRRKRETHTGTDTQRERDCVCVCTFPCSKGRNASLRARIVQAEMRAGFARLRRLTPVRRPRWQGRVLQLPGRRPRR